MSKPSIPKGTRDFLPEQSIKRRYIFRKIEEVFLNFGYRPIDTPALENLSTLTGKYGEEGDRLLFKVLNNGDFLAKADSDALSARDSQRLVPSISKRGLRYDLTVPFARFVSMYQNDISLPFKRYQIQPVWRADRPQKGRYQEFYQCDVDVVGSTSLVYEAELIQIYDRVFSELNLPVTIVWNHRKILAAIAELAFVPERLTEMTIVIDKMDKIGLEGCKKELENRSFTKAQVDKILTLVQKKYAELKSELKSTKVGNEGVEEIEQVMAFLEGNDLSNVLELDIRLARGLSYYTGCIFEVKTDLAQIGSLGGGGRYDDLTGIFGLNNVSGVGVSFGAARIYDVLEASKRFPGNLQTEVALLFLPMSSQDLKYTFDLCSGLRQKGVSVDTYPEAVKLKKQLKYASQRGIKYVGIVGSAEREKGAVLIKNMHTGDQEMVDVRDIEGYIR